MRLKAEHISYKYPGGSREVLSDVSLELGSTDRLGIAAPSGFGRRRSVRSWQATARRRRDVSVWTICCFRRAVTARCR